MKLIALCGLFVYTMGKYKKDWNLSNLPPEGHRDVGQFFYEDLYETARAEKERLNLHDRWLEEHRMYRNVHFSDMDRIKKKERISLNFWFANVNRTVSNLTANRPTVEVVRTDGITDQADEIFSEKIKQWTSEAEHERSIVRSATNMEVYGTTIEKSVYSLRKQRPAIVVKDLFAVCPAPGYYEDISSDCPYIADAIPMRVDEIKSLYNLSPKVDIPADDLYSIMGEERSEVSSVGPTGAQSSAQNYSGSYSDKGRVADEQMYKINRALVVEIWVRDYAEEKVEVADGVKESRLKYPGGIRVITIVKGKGTMPADRYIVLNDIANPNINPAIPRQQTRNCFLYDRFPYFKANSYEDTNSIWGFSSYEQVGDILKKVDELFSRMTAHFNRICLPPLVLPKDTGITRNMVNNNPGLILMPKNTVSSQGVRFLQIPNLPSDFWNILNSYISFFDRISQIEDADRGVAPKRIVAASAIASLQERGAVLVRAKIRSIDYLERMRGRASVSHYQNFHTVQEFVDVKDTPQPFIGVNYVGRRFNYIVESGSTIFKSAQAEREETFDLWKSGAFGPVGSANASRVLLERLGFKDWKTIIERMAEDQLNMVAQILINSGLDPKMVQEIVQMAMKPQGGPGDTKQAGGGQGAVPNQDAEPPEISAQEELR